MDEARHTNEPISMLAFFSMRRDRHALQQLTSAITYGITPDLMGCAEAPAVADALLKIQHSKSEADSRIKELECELETARDL